MLGGVHCTRSKPTYYPAKNPRKVFFSGKISSCAQLTIPMPRKKKRTNSAGDRRPGYSAGDRRPGCCARLWQWMTTPSPKRPKPQRDVSKPGCCRRAWNWCCSSLSTCCCYCPPSSPSSSNDVEVPLVTTSGDVVIVKMKVSWV
jgi:hypothetical protein